MSEISAARFLPWAPEEAPTSAASLTIILLPASYGHAPGRMMRKRMRTVSLRWLRLARKCSR